VVFVILVTLVGMAAANGANDVSKGVATLAGSGVTAYRTAIIWGTLTTLLGAVLSIRLAGEMSRLFSEGIVDAPPTTGFALAVLLGAASWVALASVARLPVSTTHSIVGSLVGAGLVLAPSSIRWDGVAQKALLPLLLSVLAAYAVSVALAVTAQAFSGGRPGRRAPVAARTPARAPATGPDPQSRPEPRSAAHASARSRSDRVLGGLHWISSGAVSCARGLNDTPKIAAVGGFALIPNGYSAATVSLLVAGGMAVGSLAGVPVARRLGEKVVKMTHTEGFTANLTTAGLVGAGAVLALPMSTTHVSTGAIAGSAGRQLRRLSGRTIRDFLIAWTVTPFVSGAVAALALTIAG
jgi:PiT family inorganic phosphate transporter